MFEAIITALICVTSVGALCAIILVLAAKFMAVKENELTKKIRETLPGANCGACGYSGCDGYAKALSEEKNIKTNLCIPGGDTVSKCVSDCLGVAFEDVIEQVATIHCCGDCDHSVKKAVYDGVSSCAAAKMVYGGPNQCVYGCIGLGDCVSVCPEHAINISNGIANINSRECVGCGKCAITCPNHLITMMADKKRVVITCQNTDKGAVARKECTNACIKCKKCEINCPSGAIKVTDVAKIDYDKCTNCGKCAEVCPIKCIKEANYSGCHNFN